jgi:hypothetical protein
LLANVILFRAVSQRDATRRDRQGLKLSACGQELGGSMLFGRRIGFSGTPSDILPVELGSCHYERGSDGKVVHFLSSAQVVSFVQISPGTSHQCLPGRSAVQSSSQHVHIAQAGTFSRFLRLSRTAAITR